MSTNPISANGAPVSPAVIAEALELRRLIRSVLSESPPVNVEAAPATEARSCADSDRTDNRIRAYLASIRPLRGSCYREDIEAANQRGRSLIERLALSAEGTDLPRLRLAGAEVADVLSFIACSEPIDPQNWWEDDVDGPSHLVGHYLLLQALEKSLREPGDAARPVRIPARAAAESEEARPA